MKTFILKFVLPVALPLLAILAIGPGCGPGTPPVAVCNTSATSPFLTLYNSFGTDQYSYDWQTYEYTFTTSTAGNICAVGYQGHVALASIAGAYKIEILDNGAVVSSGTYSFGSGAINYQSIASVPVSPGHTYTMRRTVVNNLGDPINTISHFKALPTSFTPIAVGPITITGTKLYEQYAAASPYNIKVNTALGCIDFIMN
jgi:hypothetical protein